MKIIVFDTETSGLPGMGKQTTIVQFSYVIYDSERNEVIKEVDQIIRQPFGFIIPEDSIRIHGITNEMCENNGVDLMNILNEFILDTRDCYRIVGHNVKFDVRMMVSSLRDLQKDIIHATNCKNIERKINYIENHMIPKLYCTMLHGTDRCKLPKNSKYGLSMTSYKFPKLSELHIKLFGNCPDGLHNALVDVKACLNCYIEMTRYM
jgi:DNA polymerase III epsilon subunit-like protein